MMNSIIRSTPQLNGVVLAVASVAMFALETAAARQIGADVPTSQLAFLRSIGGLCLVFVVARSDGFSVFLTTALGLQFLRASLSIIGVFAYFYAFARLPLADATAITYTKAFFLIAIAAFFLKEQVSGRRWFGTILGATGTFIILRPTGSQFEAAYLVALLSAGLSAALIALTKIIEKRDSARTVMAYVATLSFLAYSGPAYYSWAPISGADAPYVLSIAILGPLGQYLGILAIRATDASVLAPIDYLRLFFAAVIGFSFFGIRPDLASIMGMACIVGGCLISASSAKRKV
ncbi:DMT family transporter [Roseomonas nepalensis]|uniref:DMT family transporter n=1 Tax=Muricoccus nepalensis TaxID=1854500 RepID=A0A502FS06_9PROT|nr:DMT family transporter [Roseomonas nepalensis]TPG52298.1 DMT family transporter [Roseomonas nepalensis]